MSRLAPPATAPRVVGTHPPVDSNPGFSNFDFVDTEYEGSPPIRRLFSQARARGFLTLVVESVPATGAVADENSELRQMFKDYQMEACHRVSFWRTSFSSAASIPDQCDDNCVGWAVLKLDRLPSKKLRAWHVFESVIRKYENRHNFAPCAKPISFRVGESEFRVPGVLFCQQNGLNKACAQVALRSICSGFLNDPDLTFRRINRLAFSPKQPKNPGAGLTTDQIDKVLEGLGIPHFSIYYPNLNNRQKWRSRLPYQKILYSGIECGAGALLAFAISGPRAPDCGHIIPLIGHTFNEDFWAPRAEGAYFQVGKDIRYIPSSAWMSSFVVHDDNFGSNLCVAKDYVRPDRADYVVALYPLGYAAPGFVAEIAASRYFYSLLNDLDGSGNRWVDRLLHSVQNQSLILRTVAVTREDYVAHLGKIEDWHAQREDANTISDLQSLLPGTMWMTEVSIPDLFSTNLRKLGEILLDSALTISERPDYSKFVLARFPGRYVQFHQLDGHGHPAFLTAPSAIRSHTPLLSR